MSATLPELTGALIACAAAAAALLLRAPHRRYLALGVALAAAAALIAGDVWEQQRFQDFRDQPVAIVMALLLVGMALGATAATFVRVPAAFAIAAFAVLPLRVPLQIGGETNFLLLPLYGVIAGGWLRGAWLIARGRAGELESDSSPAAAEQPGVRWLCLALALALLVYGAGVAWTDDPTNATRNVAFFLAPFAALFALLRDLRWHRKLLFQVLVASALAALLFAAVAFWQRATRDLTFNKELIEANQLHMYFRVNSVFRDPNVFGRYLALAIIALAAWCAWRRPAWQALAGALTAAVLLVALSFTFSQTSFLALAAGLVALAWLRLGLRGLALALGAAAAAVALFLALGGMPKSDFEKQREDLAELGSGRVSLISGGAELFAERPVAGWGSGSFANSFRREIERISRPVSHTEPITVAAEQGILGLVPYVAIVLLSLLVVARPWPRASAARAAVAACFAALLVHSLGYAGFTIDPATWALLALGVALRE